MLQQAGEMGDGREDCLGLAVEDNKVFRKQALEESDLEPRWESIALHQRLGTEDQNE